MTPPITAAVTAFNGVHDLPDCIRSLRAQQGIAFAEVIVVDNGSTDGTAELVAREFPDVRLIRLEQNDGPCPARNVALREARHRLVYQVDQDVVTRPDCVARLLAEIEAADDVAVASPRGLDAADPSIVHYDGGWFHYAGVIALRHFFQPVAQCPDEPLDVDVFVSLAVLADRDKLLEVGGYDPAFFILFEDHDLSYRVRMRGYRVRSVPAALVDHRSGTAGISFRGGSSYPARRLFLHSRNRWLVVLKCYHGRTLLLALPGILLLGVAYVFFAWRQGALGDYVRAKSSLLANLPRLREERRRLQALRRVRDRDLLGAPDLTFSPRIERGPGASVLERGLGAVLRAWWAIIRPFVA